MPRANRYFLPNHVWHLTRRCHELVTLGQRGTRIGVVGEERKDA
jgi:hypothetical protein